MTFLLSLKAEASEVATDGSIAPMRGASAAQGQRWRAIEGVCSDYQATLAEFNGEPDHVHLLVTYPPQVSLSKLINSLKGVSSRRLKVLHPDIRRYYWGRALWSRSYFAASVGGAPLEVLRQYIEQQAAPLD